MNAQAARQQDWQEHYARAWRLGAMLTFGLGLAGTSLLMFSDTKTKSHFVAMLVLAVGGFFIAKSVLWLMQGGLVFKYNAEGLEVPSLMGKRRVRWQDVLGIQVMKRTTYLYGFIPVRSTHSLYVKQVDGSKIFVPTKVAGLSHQEMMELGILFERLRNSGGFVAGGNFSGDAASETGFDADAVVARYMAKKNAGDMVAAPSVATTAYRPSGTMGTSNGSFGKRRA